jgi:hypothetical protein
MESATPSLLARGTGRISSMDMPLWHELGHVTHRCRGVRVRVVLTQPVDRERKSLAHSLPGRVYILILPYDKAVMRGVVHMLYDHTYTRGSYLYTNTTERYYILINLFNSSGYSRFPHNVFILILVYFQFSLLAVII